MFFIESQAEEWIWIVIIVNVPNVLMSESWKKQKNYKKYMSVINHVSIYIWKVILNKW